MKTNDKIADALARKLADRVQALKHATSPEIKRALENEIKDIRQRIVGTLADALRNKKFHHP